MLKNPESYVIAYMPRVSADALIIRPLIEPTTVIAVFQSAMAAFEKQDFSNWKDDVSSRLEVISQKLDEIIAELKSLRLWLDSRFTEEANKLFHSQIDSMRRGVEDMIGGSPNKPLTDEQKARLADSYYDQTKLVTSQLANWSYYGFAHYHGVLTGILTVLLITEKVPSNPKQAEEYLQETKQFAKRMITDFLQPAIDPSNNRSLEYARNQIAKQILDSNNHLNSFLNRWWKTNQWGMMDLLNTSPDGFGGGGAGPGEPPRPHGPYRWIQMYPTGNVAKGFSRQVNSGESRPAPDIPFYPTIPFPVSIRENGEDSWSYIIQDLERMRNVVLAGMAAESIMKTHINEINKIIESLEQYISTHKPGAVG